MISRQKELKELRNQIAVTLHDFAEKFAAHHTEDGDDYWWGYDTNLGDMQAEFKEFIDKFHKLSAEYRFAGETRYISNTTHNSRTLIKRRKTMLRKEIEEKKVR